MSKYRLMLSVSLVAVVAVILGTAVQWSWAKEHKEKEDKEVIEFAETEIFFEYNSSDLDLGIQIFFDAEGWKKVDVTGPDGRIFSFKNGKGLKDVGSTEVFTESAEPELDEENLEESIAEFQAQFPEGEYVFTGRTVDGKKLEGTAELTHDLPAAVELDLEDFPIIEWTPGAGGPAIVRYEVIVEMVVDDGAGGEHVFVNTATLPATETSFTVSEVFADLADDFEQAGDLLELKVEVLAEEASGNNTITEEAVFEAEE